MRVTDKIADGPPSRWNGKVQLARLWAPRVSLGAPKRQSCMSVFFSLEGGVGLSMVMETEKPLDLQSPSQRPRKEQTAQVPVGVQRQEETKVSALRQAESWFSLLPPFRSIQASRSSTLGRAILGRALLGLPLKCQSDPELPLRRVP